MSDIELPAVDDFLPAEKRWTTANFLACTEAYARAAILADREKRAQAAQGVVHQHGFAQPNRMLHAINESLDKQLEEAMAERDSAEDFADTILDLVLGKDRAEWSSAYGRADALIEVEEHMAALPPSEAEPEPQGVQESEFDPFAGCVPIRKIQTPYGEATAYTEASKPVQAEAPTASNERQPLSERAFSEWLNANRNRDVSSIFHDTVAHYAAALATQPPAIPAAPAVQASGEPEADMFWDHSDGENFGHDIDEIIQDYDPGEIVKIDQAKRLPMITVRVLPAKDDNSYFEYEVIDDDAARAAQQATGEQS